VLQFEKGRERGRGVKGYLYLFIQNRVVRTPRLRVSGVIPGVSELLELAPKKVFPMKSPWAFGTTKSIGLVPRYPEEFSS
jgi:hypothetical protein